MFIEKSRLKNDSLRFRLMNSAGFFSLKQRYQIMKLVFEQKINIKYISIEKYPKLFILPISDSVFYFTDIFDFLRKMLAGLFYHRGQLLASLKLSFVLMCETFKGYCFSVSSLCFVFIATVAHKHTDNTILQI